MVFKKQFYKESWMNELLDEIKGTKPNSGHQIFQTKACSKKGYKNDLYQISSNLKQKIVVHSSKEEKVKSLSNHHIFYHSDLC